MILDGFKMLCNRSHPTFSSIDITLARLACREHSAFSCEVEMHLTWRTLTYPTVSVIPYPPSQGLGTISPEGDTLNRSLKIPLFNCSWEGSIFLRKNCRFAHLHL